LLLDLGNQPLANEYHDATVSLPEFPLAINLCNRCFHCQQSIAVDPDDMFRNYLYVSGTSQSLMDYFDWFATMVNEKIPGGNDRKMLDIASNDGSQLAAFQKLGWKGWGVDPAKNLYEQAKKTGANITCDYWTRDVAHQLGETFDAIVAQNVFAHTANPLEFLKTCASVMHRNTKIFIQTSQAQMFYNGEFDTIYHEHISFFSAKSLQTLAHRAGLFVEDIFTTPIHGTSYIFVLGYDSDETKAKSFIEQERQNGRYTKKLYRNFADTASSTVKHLSDIIETYRLKHYSIVGFGAAAKGNTLLNFGRIRLDCIVDDNPLKQGLLTPGMNIPIIPIQDIATKPHPMVIVVLAWNFFDEIRKKTKMLRPDCDDIFITYFPKITERL
jgi:SAM-dependent methyltransferase